MTLQKEFLDMIENDINRIDDFLDNGTDNTRWELFRELDGKYQVCIEGFYNGMWMSVHSKNTIHYSSLQAHPEYVADNLKMIKSKLSVFRFQANAVALPQVPTTQVNVTTNVNLNVTFEQVRSQIEDMTSLTDKETEEILEKITELEKIINSKDKKKTKWEQAKGVLVWLANKSFDVGMALLPLLLKIQD